MGDTNLDTVVASTFTGDLTGNATGELNFTVVARTATGTGATTGTIADAGLLQHVTVTSGSANDIIILPTPTPGTIVVLAVGANGYELRSDTPGSVAINGGTGANAESAMAANGMAFVVCTSATTWQGFDIDGTTLAAIMAAA